MTRTKFALVTAAATALVAGCSAGSADGYPTPAKVCGIDVPPAVTGPLLPAGRNVEQYPEAFDKKPDSIGSCIVNVDKKLALRIAVYRESGKVDVPELAREGSLRLKNPEAADIENVSSAQVAEDGALMTIPCRARGTDYLVTEFAIGERSWDRVSTKDQRKELDAFVRSYVPELIKVKCDA
ncbi:hypothetical protein ACFC0C_07390 [Streptomyces sp. NPDC056178]|uniref:hypothetical protein n=1 Tax=Streptomyces sp. NPDC056178 TaxID=3345735 RepID=UPI0035D66A95